MKRNDLFTFAGVIALLIRIVKESIDTITLYSWISLFLLFMAGINIRYKIKFFVFLAVLLSIQCVVTIIRKKTTGGTISMRRILLFAAGVLISMVPLVLLYSGISSPLYYLLAAISLGGIEAVLLLTKPGKDSTSGSKGTQS